MKKPPQPKALRGVVAMSFAIGVAASTGGVVGTAVAGPALQPPLVHSVSITSDGSKGAVAFETPLDQFSSLLSRFNSFTSDFDISAFRDVIGQCIRAQMAMRDMLRSAESSLSTMSDQVIAAAALTRQHLPPINPENGHRDNDQTWISIDVSVLAAEPVPGRQSSGFGWRSDPFHRGTKFHRGTDVRAPHGTAIGAAGPGLVILAGQQNGYGNVVYIDHGGGLVTRYGHMSRIVTQKGATVSAGQLIGKVGATGRATGPHLHFEVRLDGRAVNPNDAMRVAALKRAGDASASLAMLALSPEVQEASNSKQDPPGSRIAKSIRPSTIGKQGKSRPERRGRGKRSKAVS